MSEPASSTDALEMQPLTIPVHVEIRSESVVLNQPEMAELLQAAELIAVGPCACREEKANCDAPLDVCLARDGEAQKQIESNGWRSIEAEDALGLLEETYCAGLVHLAYHNEQGDVHLVCSCCSCCCGFLTSVAPRRYRDALITSTYIAAYNPEACTHCGICIDRCVFGAFSRDPATNAVAFDGERCFGCGLCVGTCPSVAIAFVERR
jgi:Pyruvate/2-oxoacid:ferredoxin oxidoreductase delta subunit